MITVLVHSGVLEACIPQSSGFRFQHSFLTFAILTEVRKLGLSLRGPFGSAVVAIATYSMVGAFLGLMPIICTVILLGPT